MSAVERLYGAVLSAGLAVSPLVGLLRPRLAASVAERRAAAGLMSAWARRSRRRDVRLLWLHGASAGELLGAAPALGVLRGRRDRGELQLVVTYSSASGRDAVRRLAPDFHGFAPADTSAQCRAAMRGVLPAALCFAKLDVWPGLTRAAAEAGVPLGLINGTVRPGSSRLRPAARRLLRPSYARLDRVGAATPDDLERLLALGVRREAASVTGDAAFDLALQRADAARRDPTSPHRRLAVGDRAALRLVAGSTWPEDEDLLLAAAAELAAQGIRYRLVLVPHQPTTAALRRLSARCEQVWGGRPVLWSELAGPPPPAVPVAVDRLGLLAELYLAADVAYVGGGLGDSGLHSVIEPAAAGVPVLFGSRHDRREATELLDREAAAEVSARTVAGVLRGLAERPTERVRMGQRGRAYVEGGAGAARASAALLAELLALRPQA